MTGIIKKENVMKKMIFVLAIAVASFSFIMCTNNNIPVESNWTVTSLYADGNEIAVPADHSATLAFLKDSKIAGGTGCNRYFGDFKEDGNKLSFNNMGSTRMMCPDMQFEDAYLKALANVAAYRIDGGKLELLDNSGEIIAVLSQIEPVAMEN